MLTADSVVIERVSVFKNLHKYEGYGVVEFTGDDSPSGVTIRKMAGKERIKLPARGVFIAIGLQPNSSIVAHLAELNRRGEVIINPDCSTAHSGIFAAGEVTRCL